jgi:hypothetical protein
VSDLATWLLEQLDADERLALALKDRYAKSWHVRDEDACEAELVYDSDGHAVIYWETGTLDEGLQLAAHIARHDPAYVLADIAAKRRIVERLGWFYDWPISSAVNELEEDVLRLLALPYADRPGYDPAWAPEGES